MHIYNNVEVLHQDAKVRRITSNNNDTRIWTRNIDPKKKKLMLEFNDDEIRMNQKINVRFSSPNNVSSCFPPLYFF